MKKIYTLVAFALVGTVAFGQLSLNTTERAANKKQAQTRATETISVANTAHVGSRFDIYVEDFDGGLPSDWTTEAVEGPCDWTWTDVGHQGDFPSLSLESSTAANGWMILDSDFCGEEGGGTEVNYLTSPSIDCSAHDAVSVRFEQYFRSFQNDVTSIEVSNDGGDTWNAFILNADVTQAGTPNPDIVQINITQFAAGEADVTVRFKWEGIWDYGWQVDDFSLVVPVENDLTISATDYQMPWIAADEDTYRDLAYSVYPTSQVRDMNLRASATNNGGLEQTGVALQVNINDGAGYDETLTSSPTSLLPGESVELVIAGYTPPATVGDYNITYTLLLDAEDENLDDNVSTGSFAISESVYARDNGARNGEFTNFDLDYKLGTTFFMEVDETVHCVGVALSASSVSGTSFNMELLTGAELDYIAETNLAEVPAASELNEPGDGNFFWTWMESPTSLMAGDDIAVVVNHFGGDDDVVLSLSGNSPAQTSFFYEGSETTWFFVTSTPMIRIGLSEEFCSLVIGVDEIDAINVYDIFPNPSKGISTVQYQLLTAGEVQMFLFDAMGRVVMNQNFGKQATGEYRYDFDFSNLAAGLYTYSIQVDGKGTAKKLVIE